MQFFWEAGEMKFPVYYWTNLSYSAVKAHPTIRAQWAVNPKSIYNDRSCDLGAGPFHQ